MFRNYLLAFSLFNAAAFAQSMEPVCLEERKLSFPKSKNNYLSVCSLGNTFFNKITGRDSTFLKNVAVLQETREASRIEGRALASHVFPKLYAARNTLLKSLDNNDFEIWVDYFKLLIGAVVSLKNLNDGIGLCGEAARGSIVHSLLAQLESGNRESVQLISAHGSPILNYSNSKHAFVIYNSKPLVSGPLKDNAELLKLLRNLKPQNPKRPVITCDSWSDYHAEPDSWLEHIKNGKDHLYGQVNWQKILVINYSIPSMRQKGMSSKQRKFLIDLMKNDILSPYIKPQSAKKISRKNR